ncbi:MFS transporter [Austwickia chelonae]|uniref:Putative major facilitator superfamily transporter n=1 Tax=Austwickia chelonae NBRC 105200 TaxID=1184607 RepID=K6V960_9MICO|nr:MFS transporter [Austwickia chelonae]GAB78773.1 putative major facilitator superfamily transporter [Austwickia chelonae NBRC 105200]
MSTEPLTRDRRFVCFWLSRTISALGSAVSIVVLPILVYEQTRSALLVALVAASGTLPYLAFGLVAGAVADRVDRRRLMVGCDLACLAVLASLPLTATLDALAGPLVVLAAMASSTFALFFEAASYGLVVDLVSKERLAAANSSLFGAETTARISGTALAGLLASLIGANLTVLVDAATFGASALLIASIRVDRAARGGERNASISSPPYARDSTSSSTTRCCAS